MLEALATFGAALEAKKIRKKKLKMKVRIDKGIFFFWFRASQCLLMSIKFSALSSLVWARLYKRFEILNFFYFPRFLITCAFGFYSNTFNRPY